YEWLRSQNEQVIVVGMAGFGKTGPDAEAMGYGPIIEQMSGMTALSGYGDDGVPYKTGISYGDPIAGIGAASSAIVALIQRRKTGKGQYIDLAQREIMTAQLGEAFMDWCMNERLPEHMGNGHDWMAPHNAYRCAARPQDPNQDPLQPDVSDDQWVAIAVRTDAEWDGFVRAMGDPDWASAEEYSDQIYRWDNRESLDQHVEAWTRGLDKDEVFQACLAERVPCGPVLHTRDLFKDEQLLARDFFEEVSHEEHGAWMIHGWVWRATDAGSCVMFKAPDFGQHNAEVLGGIIGLGEAEIAELAEAGIIADAPAATPTGSEVRAAAEAAARALD
ncbi:MAG TPA: CoA transferase, partial [Dehalococcoidia bacterium]|nr:CoA transferase [Dehalococcoidia bacterium]